MTRWASLLVAAGVLGTIILFKSYDTKDKANQVNESSGQRSVRRIATSAATPPPGPPRTSRTSAPAHRNGEGTRQDIIWREPVTEPEFAAFQQWTEQYAAADEAVKRELAKEGQRLAGIRRGQFAEMMRKNPARALALAVPQTVRRALPAEVLEKLEKPLDTMGAIEHLAVLPWAEPDQSIPADSYFVVIGGNRIRAYVTQERDGQLSRERTPISGYLMEKDQGRPAEMVLRPTAGRLLEPIEVFEARGGKDSVVCPTSKEDTRVNDDEAGLRIGDTTNLFCSVRHAVSELDARTEAEMYPQADGMNGPTSGGDPNGIDSGSSTGYSVARSTGVKKVLIIRVDFPNNTAVPISVANGNAAIDTLRTKWEHWSGGRCMVDDNSTVTAEVFRMPMSTVDYGNDFDAVYNDAVAAAAAYDPNTCHLIMIAMNESVPIYAGSPGWAYVGTKKSWFRSADSAAEMTRILIHELGHCIGLNHAKSYTVADSNPVANGGEYSDYGDIYDRMGTGDFQDAFNVRSKLFLGWMDVADCPAATASGVYRVFTHDKVGASGVRGVRIGREGNYDYSIEYRTEYAGNDAFNDNGVQVRLAPVAITSNRKTALLDMTSNSADGLDDAALGVGKTFADTANGVYLTTLAKVAGANFDSMDVLVNRRSDLLPTPWTSADVGNVGTPGLASHINGVYTVHGAGADIYGTADAFHFLSQPVNGDCDIRGRVTRQVNSNAWAKTGVMIRDGAAAGAVNAMMAVSPTNGSVFQYRSATNAVTTVVYGPALNPEPNNWVRLKRVGDVVTSYVSVDGNSWSHVGTASLAMASPVAGLATCGHSNATLGAAQIDSVLVTGQVPAGNSDADADGYTYALETQLGTNPNSAASVPDNIYSGLRAWWKMDETGGYYAYDATGRSQTGILLYAPTSVAGQVGNAFELNGVDQSIKVAPLNLNSNTVTISAWVKRNGEQPDYTGIVFMAGSTASGLTFGTNNELRYRWNNVAATYQFNSGLTVPDNTWTFCTVVIQSTKATLYMRPVGQAMQSAEHNIAQAVVPFSSDLHIGKHDYSLGGRLMKGCIDDVHVYTRSLSAAEVGELYETASENAPVFAANPITGTAATEDEAYGATLADSAGDLDPGDVLTYSKVGGPSWLVVASNGNLSGTPGSNNVGANAFTVRVTDSTGLAAEAALNIQVVNVNDAPVFAANPIIKANAVSQNAYVNTLEGSATDVDAGDSLIFSKVSGPAWLSVASNGALSGTPSDGDTGLNNFTVNVMDIALASTTATLQITVTPMAWANAAGGSWPVNGNWNAGAVAGGSGIIANFAGLNLAAIATVTLDGARTIGNLTFGDTAPSHNWTLNTGTGGVLTLDVVGGSPTITVNNQTTTIGAVLAGNDGLTKAGAGTLALNAGNTYSGGTTISNGILAVGNVSALGSGNVALGTATLRVNYLSATPTLSNTLSIAAGGGALLDLTGSGAANNTLTLGTGAITVNGTLKVTRSAGGTGTTYLSAALSGSGSLEIGNTQAGTAPSTTSQGRCWFTSANAFNNFAGNIKILPGGNLCLFNGTLSGQNVTLESGGYLSLLGNATTVIGDLSGSGSFTKNAGGDALLSVASGTFSGSIAQSLLSGTGTTALTKTGAGILTLSGTSSYTGTTSVSNGTLNVTGTLGATATTVQSGGTLGGTGTLGGAVTVQNGGAIAPGVNGGVGTLSLAAKALTLSGTAAMQIGKAGTTLSTDKVAGITTVTYGGTLLVTKTGPDALFAGDSFSLFSATTYAGTFATLTLPPLGTGLSWNTSQLTVDGTIAVQGSVPSGWAAADIGATGTSGYSNHSSGVYSINGSQAAITGTADAFHSISQTLTGNGEIRARITSQANTHSAAIAGVMLRNTSDANSANVFIGLTPASGFVLQARYDVGLDTIGLGTATSNPAPNNWVRLTRSGNQITGYVSADGSTWTKIATSTIPLNTILSAGLAVTGSAVIDSVAVTSFPAVWQTEDIGATTVGKAEYFNNVFTVTGSGVDIFGAVDEFRFVRQSLSGDGSIVARVASVQDTHAWAKAGVMIRDSLTTGSKNAVMEISASAGQSCFQFRDAPSGPTNTTSKLAASAPRWIKLTRAGHVLTGSISSDGNTWQQVGTATVNMNPEIFIGLAVTSHASAVTCDAVFDNVTVTP
jgi:autotransporter-associated beta strand protein